MRRKIVAGNWKMNKNLQESVALAGEIKAALAGCPLCGVEVVVAPVFTNLYAVAQELKGTPVAVAAQNIYPKPSGAYTGEVSAPIAKSAGASKVILGHSERRQYFGETDEFLAEKVDAVLAEGMEVIFCIGEVLAQRESGSHFQVVEQQIKNALFHLPASAWSRIVLAYEPVWAIGTGLTATPEQAEEMHAHIRKVVEDKYGKQVAEDLTILYGGSCNAKNAASLFAQPDVDGGLIGGASLKAEDFKTIIAARA